MSDERPRTPKPAGWVPEPTFTEARGRRGAGSPRCQAWNANTGGQCSLPPMKGAPTCRSHGSAAPQVLVAASARLEEAKTERQVKATVAKLADAQAVLNPLEELSRLAGEILAFKDQLRDRVDKLKVLPVDDDANRGLLLAYERSIDRASGFLIAYGRLDIDSRLARIREHFADVITTVVDEALRDVGLADRSEEVRRAVGRALRARAIRSG